MEEKNKRRLWATARDIGVEFARSNIRRVVVWIITGAVTAFCNWACQPRQAPNPPVVKLQENK